MQHALGLVEVRGLSLSIVALDALTKAADVRLLEVEMNDLLGALLKFTGDAAAVRAAADAAEAVVDRLQPPGEPRAVVTDVIYAPDDRAFGVVPVGREFSPLLEAYVSYVPGEDYIAAAGSPTEARTVNGSFALGLIETQGLTAVLEALDTAAKAANVEVVGREKLGGGYVTVIIRGDVAAVRAAVEAGRARVDELSLGKVIATHVIARPSEAVLSLLPKT